MSSAICVLLVFSLAEKESFEDINSWYQDVVKLCDPQASVILVGNKCDLEDKREVEPQEGKAFADSIHAPFFETSAKINKNVEQAFHEAVRKVWEMDPSFKKTSKEDKKENEIPWYRKCLMI